ncbi:MAG: TetR/AcrR family transcriptional regulator [Clostridia bacterium]|nr:TetR/AcrR family transcriptional regulator [Clostridia bacterium]
MAGKFTDRECEQIRSALRREAWAQACSVGMKKTTVEHLAQAANISKGAFYHFYASKEMLFLEVLEQLHEQMYGRAAQVLEQWQAIPLQERATKAMLEMCRMLQESGMSAFWENDVSLLLRRLPEEILQTHYHDDEVHIRALLGPLCAEPETAKLAAATVRGLMLTVTHQAEIGPMYSQVLETLVRGACRELFPGD